MAMKADLLKPVVDMAHDMGLKIFAYSTTFDEGMRSMAFQFRLAQPHGF
jgi:hypothetical protein